MTIDLVQERLAEYRVINKTQEENAIKEICQEIALSGLARAGFFKVGAFMGGTCLRILHGLRRFSEDLDFVMLTPNENFEWDPFFKVVEEEFAAFGLKCESRDRSTASQVVKKAFLKKESFGQVLQLQYPRTRADLQRVLIKLEIDTNPPAGGAIETRHLLYPYPYAVTAHDEPSLFAGKCSALLSRNYDKGRDWYDFLWCIRRKSQMNFDLLSASLRQNGPYQGKEISMSKKWLLSALEQKIIATDWKKARMDVDRFVSEMERPSLDLWGESFFLSALEQLSSSLNE